jgi:hypothetical protein
VRVACAQQIAFVSAERKAVMVSLVNRRRGSVAVAVFDAHTHPAGMFVVTEAEAAAIRAVYEQRGEFSAAVELRRLFPAITDIAQARACARTIAGWKPLSVPLRPVKRRDLRRS